MKKLVAMMSLVMILSAGVTAFAADVTYDSENEQVTSDIAAGKSTVLITKGGSDEEISAGSIVYMNQADANSSFEAGTNFLLKKDVADGEYTVRFGGDSTATTTFYVGVAADTTGNIKMEAVGDIEQVKGGFGIGYKIETEGNYKNLLIEKTDGTVVGCALQTTISTDGGVIYGVQINADSEEALSDIANVYLSTRTVGFKEVQQ